MPAQSTPQTPSALQAFHWEPQPRAEQFVRGLVDEFLRRLPAAEQLSARMKSATGTRFFDWIEHIVLPVNPHSERRALDGGYAPAKLDKDIHGWKHANGMFPVLVAGTGAQMEVGIKVECACDFAAANGLELDGTTPPLSQFRRLLIASNDQAKLWAIERHGYRGFSTDAPSQGTSEQWLHHAEVFRTRRRDFVSDEAGFAHAGKLIDAAIADLGVDLTCDLFFAAEREYWQRRNRAAQFQKSRQDALGLGWANHDHHTYRSSRRHFATMIGMFEKLGFTCRERFYAGREAGWGAQILEQPQTGIIIFADVDLAPQELLNDFAHEPLPPLDALGTVGLWCGLHGESFLQAGMHHLECQFDFEALREQMESQGVKVMKPFTDFTYLRQAFTEGERWPVREARLEALLAAKLITPDQAGKIRQNGAIGSHLENLERNEGFKGFNQTGINEIIAATDPRRNLAPLESDAARAVGR